MSRRESLKLAKFVAEFNCAPLSIEEFAQGAELVVDSDRVSDAAKRFLDAQKDFLFVLQAHGVEIG